MEQLRDLAVVLRVVPYEERHRIVTALTLNHGKISALARNAIQSRRFGGTLEPFAASEWRFVERTGAELYRVEEASIRRSFEGLRTDFQRLALASVLNELMLALAPDREPCPEIFRLHSHALAAIEEMSELAETRLALALLNAYLGRILQWSGTPPQFKACLGCSAHFDSLAPDAELSCVFADAGWVCPSCRKTGTRHVSEREGQSFKHSSLRVTQAALRDLEGSASLPIREVPGAVKASLEEQQALFAFLEGLLIYHVPGFPKNGLKGLRFLNIESNLTPNHGA